MYFYKEKGEQVLDLRGGLVLTHNDALVKGRVKSAALHVIKFIWSKGRALTMDKD
jgi:hypothetical protein